MTATLKIENDIALITMDDGKANAISLAMLEAVNAALDEGGSLLHVTLGWLVTVSGMASGIAATMLAITDDVNLLLFLVSGTAVAATSATAAETTYEVDKAHSNVLFKIRHLLSYTAGKFGDFRGTITIDPEVRDSVKVSGSIEVASIDTDEPDRDAHLLKADFFDAATYPQITFSADKLTDVNADKTKGKAMVC